MSFASLCFSLTLTLSHSFQSVTAKKRKEVLGVRHPIPQTSSCAFIMQPQEVLAVSWTQAQATRNPQQEELLLVDAKRSSRACTISGPQCNLIHGDRRLCFVERYFARRVIWRRNCGLIVGFFCGHGISSYLGGGLFILFCCLTFSTGSRRTATSAFRLLLLCLEARDKSLSDACN